MTAFYRLGLSVVILAVPLLRRKGRERVQRKDFWLTMLSGVFLAAHFATWFFSLKLTSVASSTVLVSMHPFIVLAYGYLFKGERTRGWALVGTLMAVAGAIAVGWGDVALHTGALLGDLLAFLGAVTVSGYFLIGGHVRQRMSAVMYSVIAYGSATAVLLVAALLWGSPLVGFASVNWWIFAALAVFPTIFGHTLFNWALKFVPASVISVSILGEPIGASLLAWLIWRTAPGPLGLTGGALILAGIALFQWRRPTT